MADVLSIEEKRARIAALADARKRADDEAAKHNADVAGDAGDGRRSAQPQPTLIKERPNS